MDPKALRKEHPQPGHWAADPSLPSTAHRNSTLFRVSSVEALKPPKTNFVEIFYNSQTKQCCGRTGFSWLCMILYAIIYLIFLATYTLLLLYISLVILQLIVDFPNINPQPLQYPEAGIGLTATPATENSYPLISYKDGDRSDYSKYVTAIGKLLASGKDKRETGLLGPCGKFPYGYGDNPCIIIRINKKFHWSGRPLQKNSTMTEYVPPEVKKWMTIEKNKLWLLCNGYHSYDKEHIGGIKYYPDPPGFDADAFPLSPEGVSPLVAIQISDFTIGLSLAIECKLWYEKGPSSIDFVLYVAPNESIALTGQQYKV